MSKITEHVGQRIRTCRKKKGYTIEEFSKMINKSKATLSKYENGSIAIDIDTLLDIAEALEMDLSHLVDYISPKSKRPAAHGNSYFNSAYFYVYYYDGRGRRLIKSLMRLSHNGDYQSSVGVTLYKGVKDFSDYDNCENIYSGTLESFDATSHATLINQINKSERIHLLLMNPMQREAPAVGLLAGIGDPPYFSPVAIKIVVSKYILKEDDVFNKVIMINKNELKQYKQHNMMLVGPENYISLPTE